MTRSGDPLSFGVATADHQVEAYILPGDDVRDLWERTRGLVLRGRATDFWSHYAEDIARARDLGCRCFRLSASWARLEPRPGIYDDSTFDHYGSVLDAIRAAGMRSILTLHHFTWPLHVEERGGMTDPGFPAIFTRYAREVARRLGGRVDLWVTFNEPTQLIHGYIKPASEAEYAVPPGLAPGASSDEQVQKISALIRNLFDAHASAREMIRTEIPGAPVGANPLILGLPGWLRWLGEWFARRIKGPDRLRSQLERYGRRRLYDGGRVDVMLANLTRTLDRERDVAFSAPYYLARNAILVRADSPANAIGDVQGAVAVLRGSTAATTLYGQLPGTSPAVCLDAAAAMGAVARREVSGWLSDDVVLTPFLDSGDYRLLKGDLGTEPYCVGVAKRQSDLLVPITRVLRQFASAGRGQLVDASTGAEMEQHPAYLARPPEVPLSEVSPSVTRIRRRGWLRIGVRADETALSRKGPGDAWQGLEPDLGRALAADILGSDAKVKFVPIAPAARISALRPFLGWFESRLQLYGTLFTLVTADWWSLGMAGELSEFLCPPRCRGTQDYVGLDYYWGVRFPWPWRLQRLMDAGRGHFSRAPVWPGGLLQILRRLARRFPGRPIHIMENGSVDQADGIDRPSYLRQHVAEVLKARTLGIPVNSYVCWAITSNREWGYPFGPETDFGLFHIDLDSDVGLLRRSTPSAEAYGELVRRSSAGEHG